MIKNITINKSITKKDTESIGYYLTEVSKIKLLTEEEEIDLTQKYKSGDKEALTKIIESNLRFVITVAKKYQNNGLTLEDLICEGNVGLIKAAEKFDEKKGFKFISYAVWWIRQSILKALTDYSRIVKIPTNKNNILMRMNDKTSELSGELEREPTLEEIAECMNESSELINEIFTANKICISFDSSPFQSDEENEKTLYDLIPDINTDTEKTIKNESYLNVIDNIISTLKPKEKRIISMYYGICGYQQMNLEEIGDYMSLTRERVRQIRDNAIRHLRLRDKSRILKDLLG